MSLVYFDGFETGDTKGWTGPAASVAASTTVLITGAYTYAIDGLVANNQINNTTGAPFSLNEAWASCRFSFTSTGSPTTARGVPLLVFQDTGGTNAIATVRFVKTLAGAHVLRLFSFNIGAQIGSDIAVSTSTTYLLELHAKTGVSGGADFRLDGVVQATGAYDGGANPMLTTRHGNGTVSGAGTDTLVIYLDDVCVDNADYPGRARVLARQPVTGGATPTYNAWAKSTGTDAGALWDNTPFTTGDSCNSTSTTAANAQTAVVNSFSTTQTGHGTEVILENDRILGGQVQMIAKTSLTTSSGALSGVRARLGGVDTDTDVTLTTSDAFYRSSLMVPSVTNLTNMEAGAYKRASSAARTQTVEDVWVQVAYEVRLVARQYAVTQAVKRAATF